MNENIPIIFVVIELDDDVFRYYSFPTNYLESKHIFNYHVSQNETNNFIRIYGIT